MTLFETIALIPTVIGIYFYRITFVFSIYGLLVLYGWFGSKEDIVAHGYEQGDKYEGTELIHKFTNLQNLKNGVKFHYVTNIDTVKGDYVVVFLHGIFESWYSWHKQLEMLDKMKIPCLAIDFKNHGNTSAHYSGSVMNVTDLGKNFDLTYQGKEVCELLHMLNIKNVVFVTTDLGTLVCDKLIGQFYCPKVSGWIRCHEPMPAYPNDKGLPQKFLFWFNIKMSLFLMHNSNEMILRLFYKATGWKSCESFSATHIAIDDVTTVECLKNTLCPFTSGPYEGYNSNFMSWAGVYAYAFLNDLYTGPTLNIHAYESCKFPVFIVTGKYDKSCLLAYVDGTTSLGYKFMNGEFCSKMISYNGEDGYDFFNGEEGHIQYTNQNPRKASDYFVNSIHSELIVMPNAGHMSHLETPEEFCEILKYTLNKINCEYGIKNK